MIQEFTCMDDYFWMFILFLNALFMYLYMCVVIFRVTFMYMFVLFVKFYLFVGIKLGVREHI